MARKSGVKNGSWGYSEESLKALESGQYGQYTGRKSRYGTSSREQTQQSKELPTLKEIGSSAGRQIWESNYGKNRRNNTVDTRSARRNYENRTGHYAPDFRDLRRQGYGSSYTDIDFSQVSDFDKELLDAALTRRDNEQKLNADSMVSQWLKPSEEDKIAEAQSYIDKYGKSKNEVLDAYKMYKESEERRKREESPYLAGFKDFKSAPDRGLANLVKRASSEFFPGSDLEGIGDWLQEKTGVKEVEKLRDYSRNSNKIGAVKKAFLDPYFQYGDLASTELAGALLGGGMAMADPAVGFGLSIEPTAGLGTAIKAGTGYGLTAQEKYDELIKQGVDPEKASQMANMSGLSMAAAMAAGKLVPSLGADTPLATRLLTNGGISGTIMSAREAADQIADMLMLGDQSAYNGKVQNYMAQGKSEADAHKAARNDLLASDLGGYLFGMLTGAGSELASNGLSKALSKGVNKVDDTLNSVWATQPALEDKGVPRLTGTVNNTQALPGSGNLPALVDNIYPIQMPGTQGVIQMPGTNGVIAPMIEGASTPAYANEAATTTAPKVVAKLTGYELEKAVSKRDRMAQELAQIKEQIPKQYEIASTSVKSKKNAEFKKLEALRAKEAGLTYDLYALDRKINGQSEVSKTDKHMLTELSKDIKKVGNMYGGKEGKAIAKQAIDALERYEKSGLVKDYFDFYNNVIALENASVNPYTSKSGNTSTYSTYHNAENGGLLTRMTAPPQSDDEETSLVFKALMSLLDMNQRTGESAPVETPIETPIPQVPQEQIDEIMTRNVGSNRPYIKSTSEADKAKAALDAERIGLPLTEGEQTALDNVNAIPEVTSKPKAKQSALAKKINSFAKSDRKFYDYKDKQGRTHTIAKNEDGTFRHYRMGEHTDPEDYPIPVYDEVSLPTVEDVVNYIEGSNTPSNTVAQPGSNPNFTTVGKPYTPQEVPSVTNTPPTTPPPTQEVPNMDGKMKTSEYYNNTMRGTETNRNMSDEEYRGRFDEETFKRMTIPEQKSVSMGRDFIKESGGEEKAIQRLLAGEFDSEERFSGYHIDAAEMLANSIEQQALELEAQGQDASQLWRTANKLHKKIQLNASDFGVGLQALQKWKKSTPQGAFDDLISQVNKGIDKKKTTGYSRNVNTLADKIVDAVENSDNKADLTSKIKNIFAEDRKNNPYNTNKAEQLVLDLVGGDKNTKMSITDLADEAGKLIKKQMGVSSLTPKEERAVLNLLDAASKLEPGTRAYNELVSQAMVIVDEALPVTAGEKFKSLLYDNMLASIKTMFTRNFGGNVVGNAIDAMAAPFQVGADAVVGKFTGARTRSLTGKSIVEAAKGLGHGFKDWGQDIGYSLKNKTAFNTPRSGQESLADVLQAVHKTWKTQSQNKAVKAVHNALSAYDYIIRKGMEGGDRPIYEAQYAATKAELYDVVDKYGDAGIRKGLPADKRDIDTDDLIEAMAINEALEAVLQNDSKMKEAAKNLKSFFKKSSEDMLGIDVASMSHAPFVEVPANMASNFFKLTPIGWAGNIARTIGEKKKYGNINQRRFTGELGLNVLGGLMGAGLFAVADKYISDKISDKKEEKKIQQNNGYQEYALQTPDEGTQIDISDIPYLGGMMKFSKLERDAYNEGKKTGGTAGGIKSALSEIPSAASAATVDTLYSALNRLTGADFQYNGDSNLITNAVNNIKSSVGSMGVPSLIRQTAQFTDPYKRDLGDYGTDEYNKNLIINGIPGLRQTLLEPKIDTAGNPVPELGGATGLSRFLSAYVSPWKVSHPHANTSAVQEYANMLNQRTEGKVNPQMKVINKSDLTGITGYDAENYSHADLRKLQESYYKSNTELGNALINDPWFTNLSDEKQGELLNELWTANKALVKENFVREGLTPEQIEAKGDELYTTDNKLAQILRDDDKNHTGLLKWLKDETGRDEMNAKYGTEMTHDKYVDYNSREEGYAEQRASEADKAKALDMSVDSYEKYEAEYPGGAQGYYDDKQGAIQYGFVNANKVANVDNYRIAKELGDGDPDVMQAYSDYKQEGIASNAYGAKAAYLIDDDRLTDEQKGMIIVGSQDGSKIGKLAQGARGVYDVGNSNNNHDGYAGVYYYYLLKNQADVDGSGTVSKKERQAFFEQDNPMLDELWNFNNDMYEYLMKNLK